MKILLTGASGFIGRHIFPKLLSAGHEVLTLGRRPESPSSLHCSADISCWGTFEQKIRSFAPDACIHAAWIQTHDYTEAVCRVNQIASVNFLNFCFGLPSIRTVVGIGSCLEYSPQEGACREDVFPQPATWFSWAKNCIRSYGDIEAKNREKEFRWARVFFAYGPGQRDSALIPSTIRLLLAGRNATPKNPEALCDFVHVDDVAEGVVRAATESGGESFAFNLGGGNPVRVGDVVEALAGIFEGRISKLAECHSVGGMWSDNSFVRSALRWSPSISIDEGLAQLAKQALQSTPKP